MNVAPSDLGRPPCRSEANTVSERSEPGESDVTHLLHSSPQAFVVRKPSSAVLSRAGERLNTNARSCIAHRRRTPEKSTPVLFIGEEAVVLRSAAALSRLRAFLTVYAASFPAQDVEGGWFRVKLPIVNCRRSCGREHIVASHPRTFLSVVIGLEHDRKGSTASAVGYCAQNTSAR